MSDYQGNIIIKNPATPTGPSAYGSAPGMWKLNEVAYWIKQGVWPNPAITPDIYFPYVSLLLSTTSLGNANNNLFVDSSGAFNPVSRNGNTTQGSFTPYSTNWSNYFDGSGDYLTVPDNAALDFGTGDFTIEMWINAQNLSSIPMFFHKGLSSTGWFFQTSATTLYFGQLDSARYTTWTVSLADNGWYHIALTRVGAVLNVFVNGVSQGAKTVTNANLSNDNGDVLNIGRFSTGSYQYQGYISNYRVVKGTAVYTSNFTPSTTPLTAISGTSLLTCQSNRFRDASTNNFTITVNGNTSVQDFSPFSPAYPGASYNQSDITNWSGYFDGSGDYLTVPYSTALQLPGDFTIETWVYLNSRVTSFPCIVANYSTYATNGGFALFAGHNFNTTKYTVSFNGSFPVLTSSSSIVYGVWTHLAVVRSGSTLTLYVNGVSEATATNSATVTGTGDNWWIATSGDSTTSSYINGSISNLRVVKGTAVYTSNFTPPTTNLTAISGTSLLTLQNAAFTDNSANNFVITQNGNPTVTGNSPFNTVGYWSNLFGANTFIRAGSSANLTLGSGSFTCECWVYPTAFTTLYAALWDFRNGANFQAAAPLIWIGTDGKVNYQNAAIASSSALTLNTWTHVAVVRNGTTVTMYFNGVSVGSTTDSTTMTNTYCGIGATNDVPGSYYVSGYISNSRVVIGSAVYTAAFTPPTAPLTAISGTALLTCQNGRFIDNSTNNFTMAINGAPSIQSFDPFYTATIASNGGSMYFDGSGDYLTMPSSPAFEVGTGQFTLECWIYFNTVTNINEFLWADASGTTGGRLVMYYSGGSLQIVAAGGAGGTSASFTFVAGQWYHVAASRDASNNQRLFVNGALLATATSTNNYTQNGFAVARAASLNGYMAGIRLVKGTALYTAAFTPPTAPVTPTAATTLLLNGMNAGIYDATTINDMETVGNAQVSTVQSKFGGTSMYFDGSGDYLATQGLSANFAFGTSDFTIEMWIYFNDVTSLQCFYDPRPSGTQGAYPALYVESGTLRFNSNTTDLITTSVSTGQWYHIAVSRSGSTTRMFKDGVSVGTYGSLITYLNGGAGRPGIGGGGFSTSTFFLNGYIDDLRVTKGIARYTSNFTPPTQAFPTY